MTQQRHLLRVLHDRDIPFTADDLDWAFAQSPTRDQAETFVREHLQPSTLLSHDELTFSQREGQSLASDAAVSHGRPLSDDEFEAAIDALKASTAAIEKQSRILETQKMALQEVRARNASPTTGTGTGAGAADGRRQKIIPDKAQLDLESEELSMHAASCLASASKQTDAVTAGLPSQVDRLLQKDDRLLDGLQKLLPKVSEASSDGEESASVEMLCSALANVAIREIQSRLNRAYREGSAEYFSSSQKKGIRNETLTEQQRKQRETLRTELEELGGEVDGLVSIVIDHQYRKPLQRSHVSALVESQVQRTKWSEYTISALTYITSRLDAINEHVQRLHAHDAALRAVSTTLEDLISTSQSKQASTVATRFQTPERSNARGLKPLRLVQANLSEGQDPAIQFLRQHEVRLADVDNLPKLLDTMGTALRDRNARLSNLTRSLDHSTSDAVAQSLAKTDGETRDLLCAVYVHSIFGSVKLVDQHVQRNMDRLEADTQRLGDDMRELNIDAIARALTAKRAEVVQQLTQ